MWIRVTEDGFPLLFTEEKNALMAVAVAPLYKREKKVEHKTRPPVTPEDVVTVGGESA
jgi:hypothetical protein